MRAALLNGVIMKSGDDEPTIEGLARLREEAAGLAAEAQTMAKRQTELLSRLRELREKIEAHRKFLDEPRGGH